MIKKVGKFKAGDVIEYEGNRVTIKKFITRNTAILIPINPDRAGYSWAKVSISELETDEEIQKREARGLTHYRSFVLPDRGEKS